MSKREATRLARLLLASMADLNGPGPRLARLDRLQNECGLESQLVIARAREIVRNGV